MEPLISVIVPAYNSAPYLKKCIQSILNQTYKNLEIVIIDDGSTDQTPNILDRLAEKYPEKIVVRHKTNGGVTNARLDGIKIAQGQWIGFVDGDDEIAPDMYERLMKNAMEAEADISHCGYQTIVNDGERIHYFYNTGKKIIQDHVTGLKDLVEGSFIEPGLWNKLFKRCMFDRLLSDNVFDRSIKINEDLLMNYILFDQASLSIFEDFCPYYYMSRKSSATRNKFNIHKAIDPVKVRKWMMEHACDEVLPLAHKQYVIACANACADLYSNKSAKQEYSHIKAELCRNKKQWGLLSKKMKYKIYLIVYFPKLFQIIYGIYTVCFQKKIYE